MKVNYLIACSSHRADKVDSSKFRGADVLRHHLYQLALTDTSIIAQVTIIRALPLERNPESSVYWDVDFIIKSIRCPVVFLDVEDRYFSYSSWIHAIQKWRTDFDYYVLIEDDYYPAIPNFAEVLIDIHKEKLPNGGYLNSFTTDHAAVSNGIIDSRSAVTSLSRYPDPIEALSPGAQRMFGRICSSTPLVDYTDKYRCLFWCGVLVEQTHNINLRYQKDIFLPIQYLNTRDLAEPSVLEYLL